MGLQLPTQDKGGFFLCHRKNMVLVDKTNGWNVENDSDERGLKNNGLLVTPTTEGGGLFGVWMKYVFGLKKITYGSLNLAAQEQKIMTICSMTFRFRVYRTVVHNVKKIE